MPSLGIGKSSEKGGVFGSAIGHRLSAGVLVLLLGEVAAEEGGSAAVGLPLGGVVAGPLDEGLHFAQHVDGGIGLLPFGDLRGGDWIRAPALAYAREHGNDGGAIGGGGKTIRRGWRTSRLLRLCARFLYPYLYPYYYYYRG